MKEIALQKIDPVPIFCNAMSCINNPYPPMGIWDTYV